MGRVLTWGRSQLRILVGPGPRRPFALVTGIFAVFLLLILVVGAVQLVPMWVAGWQGAHGHYPTGHLTYAVPHGWDTTTFIGLNPSGTDAWWGAFDDTVTAVSPSYSACFTQEQCASNPPDGARVDLESAARRGQPTIEAWYRAWADATTRRFGADVTLPLADYIRVPLGGQTALCAANQAGSQMLPPHPLPSPHFDTTFPGYVAYGGAAVVMCFVLWQSRAYYVEVTVQLHTASQAADQRDATGMLDSLRFV